MTFWTVFAACMLAAVVQISFGYFIAWLTDEDRKNKKSDSEDAAAINEWIELNKKQPKEIPKDTSQPKELDHTERLCLFSDIIEAFEGLLDEKGIVIENDEKKEELYSSNIYGTDYGNLEYAIERILIGYGLLDEERR